MNWYKFVYIFGFFVALRFKHRLLLMRLLVLCILCVKGRAYEAFGLSPWPLQAGPLLCCTGAPHLNSSVVESNINHFGLVKVKHHFSLKGWWLRLLCKPCLRFFPFLTNRQVCFDHTGCLAPLLAALVAAVLFVLWGLSPAIPGGAIWWFLGYPGIAEDGSGWLVYLHKLGGMYHSHKELGFNTGEVGVWATNIWNLGSTINSHSIEWQTCELN